MLPFLCRLGCCSCSLLLEHLRCDPASFGTMAAAMGQVCLRCLPCHVCGFLSKVYAGHAPADINGNATPRNTGGGVAGKDDPRGDHSAVLRVSHDILPVRGTSRGGRA